MRHKFTERGGGMGALARGGRAQRRRSEEIRGGQGKGK